MPTQTTTATGSSYGDREKKIFHEEDLAMIGSFAGERPVSGKGVGQYSARLAFRCGALRIVLRKAGTH